MSETLLNTLLKEAKATIKENNEKALMEAWKDNVFLNKEEKNQEKEEVSIAL